MMSQRHPYRNLARARRPAAAVALACALIGSAAIQAPALAQDARSSAREWPGSFASMVKDQLPAVVNIATEQKIAGTQARPNLPPGLEEFFGEFFGNLPQESPARNVTALGSGFIISADGYVVTNNHVVEKATTVQIVLSDDRTFDARIVGQDAPTDLALLKVESGEPLPFVKWGNSSELQIGDWVVAVGNPFGLGGTVTAGVLSARARDIQAGPYDNFLQTDAPINSGNSGGPLFDRNGTVIGVNTAIFSPSGGGNVGIGFAVPSSTAQPIIEQLREKGSVTRGWLGVQIQVLTEAMAKAIDLKETDGALIADVTAGSPAAQAGLKAGDVILAYDGEEIGRLRDLPRLVANTQVGKRVPLTVWRQGERQSVEVTIAARPGREALASADGTGTGTGEATGELGLALGEITDQARRSLGLDEEVKGALVTQLKTDSPAARAGLRTGDVIVSVAGQPVASPSEAVEGIKAAQNKKKGPILMRVNRRGDHLFVALEKESG